MRLYGMLPLVIVLLQHEKRVTYRALKRDLGFDDAFIAELRDELAFKQLAPDEDGKGLVWIGDSQPITYAEATRLELRATMSLCRLWQQQGKQEKARELLAGVYNWFMEGFDTADLQEARALLETLEE